MQHSKSCSPIYFFIYSSVLFFEAVTQLLFSSLFFAGIKMFAAEKQDIDKFSIKLKIQLEFILFFLNSCYLMGEIAFHYQNVLRIIQKPPEKNKNVYTLDNSCAAECLIVHLIQIAPIYSVFARFSFFFK